MKLLLDTNVAVRAVVQSDSQHELVRSTILLRLSQRDEFVLSAQVLGETWTLLTRPSTARGGFGLDSGTASILMEKLLRLAKLLPEPPGIWIEQYRLILSCGVVGVQTHDCRLAAWCLLNSVDAILTLNARDFVRYGIGVVAL